MSTSLNRSTLDALAELSAALDTLSAAWPDYFDIEVTVKLSGDPYARWHQEGGETEWFIGKDDAAPVLRTWEAP